jgi:uncharacterized membrane protein
MQNQIGSEGIGLLRERLTWAVVVLCAAGLVVSAYLTWSDLATSSDVCPITGPFECSLVTSSSYSRIGGIPVALLGAFWFIVASLLAVGVVNKTSWIKFLLAWSVLGMVGVAWLVYVELFLIASVCLLCTLTHSIGIAILILTLAIWRGGHSQELIS